MSLGVRVFRVLRGWTKVVRVAHGCAATLTMLGTGMGVILRVVAGVMGFCLWRDDRVERILGCVGNELGTGVEGELLRVV